jgi:DNA-binding NarL/FixJ family response regulator
MHIQLSSAFQQELIVLAAECEMTPQKFCTEVVENAIAERRLRSIIETGKPGVAVCTAESAMIGRRKSAFDISAAIELRQQGKTFQEIADVMGVCPATIYNRLRRAMQEPTTPVETNNPNDQP